MDPTNRDDYWKASDKSISIDEAIEILSESVRRDVINYFQVHPSDTTDIKTLANFITKEGGVDYGEDRAQETVESLLHHLHLPALAEASLVEFDPRSSQVRYVGNEKVENIQAIIRKIEEK